MHPIHRTIRLVAVVIVSALIIACGSYDATAPRAVTPPTDSIPHDSTPRDTAPMPPTLAGTWTSRLIDGNALPARIAGDTEPDGLIWDVRVMQDTLLIAADGHWVQRARTLQTQSNGFNFAGLWFDRGIVTRNGNALHFESEWMQNVAFDGEILADGTLVVLHNFTLDDHLPQMRREMQR